jgi:hypothetical protein
LSNSYAILQFELSRIDTTTAESTFEGFLHKHKLLEELIETGVIEGILTEQFSFEKEFSKDDFISMLFYLGLVSLYQVSLGINPQAKSEKMLKQTKHSSKSLILLVKRF